MKYSKLRGNARAFDVLFEAQHYHSCMARFRKERERNKNYNYGKQMDDLITVDGKTMTEEQYIRSQGNVPLKQNLIRRLVNTVIGVYRQQAKEPICVARDRDEQYLGETMSSLLQYNMQLNHSTYINARTVEEFLISGLMVHKKWSGWRNGKMDCWTDYVQPNNFFIDNNIRDFRGWDVSCIGEIHDISFNELCQRFAESPADFQRLKEIYSMSHDRAAFSEFFGSFGINTRLNADFFVATDNSRCRVIEVWRKESKPRYKCHDVNTGDYYKIDVEDYQTAVVAVNNERIQRGMAMGMAMDEIPLIEAKWFIDDYWYYYWLTPFGDILQEGETPFEHGEHPYVFKAYPFIDGEIHSFVNDIIDQQRYVNRLITLYDWIMRASAKGVLLFPEECLPKGMDLNDIAEEWSRFNGVIAIKTKGTTKLPEQIANNSTNIGITEILNLQLKFFEEITGVNGALQGKPGFSGMSAALYSQQTQNASTSLLDLLETISEFAVDSAYKDVKNIQQFYDDKRIMRIVGKDAAKHNLTPSMIRDVEFDLSIVESTSTPAYRMMANEFLMEIWRGQQISLEQLLENGHFPFADKLLQSIKSQQEQMEKGQMPDGMSPELMAQVQQGANMDAVNKAYGMLRGAA